MGYSRPMGFYMQIPAHRVGGPEKVWVTGGYGLSEVCVMAGSTVYRKFPARNGTLLLQRPLNKERITTNELNYHNPVVST